MIGIIICAIYFLIDLFLASLMNRVAKDKGYENSSVFILVLLLGVIGILYVISLPDLTARQQREDILNALLNLTQEEK